MAELCGSLPTLAHQLVQQGFDLCSRVLFRFHWDVKPEAAWPVQHVETNHRSLAKTTDTVQHHSDRHIMAPDLQLPVFLPVHPITIAPSPFGCVPAPSIHSARISSKEVSNG